MTLLERLAQLALVVPPGGSVTLPRDWLVTELGVSSSPEAPTGGDLSVEEVAAQLRRSSSTVRSWCERGLFPGAYHLPASGKVSKAGRAKVGAWRVPPAGLAAFQHRDQGRAEPAGQVNLGAWRQRRRA